MLLAWRLEGLDPLAIHVRSSVDDLDEHFAPSAAPDVTQHPLRSQAELSLRRRLWSQQDLWQQWGAHETILYKRTVYADRVPAQEAMNPETVLLEAPVGLHATLEPLLPALAGKGVKRLVVFSYRRAGEPEFWTAYLFVDGNRHSLGTPDLLSLPLDAQVPELVRRLESFGPPDSALAERLLPSD